MSVQNELLLLEKIFTYANTSPDKIALKLLEGDYTSFQTLTYRELKQKILSVSTAIEKFQLSQDQKIIRQKPILLIFDSSIEYIVSFLAILKTNNIAVTAYPPTKTRHLQRLKKIIENSNTGIIITTSQIRDYCDRNNFTFQDNTRML